MNSIVERLRLYRPIDNTSTLINEAADLIEQQAERIKELEAERDGWREDANISRNSIAMLKDRCNYLEGTLDDLHQRIDDAPVVAWMGEYNINNIRDHYTVVMRHKTDFSSMPDRVRPLYTTPQPAIPAGWQLVPVEPTPEMLDAYMKANKEYWFEYDKLDAPIGKWCAGTVKQAFEVSYKSMLAAAPKPENSHD